MFQPNYGIGNTKNNLEGLLKRCTSSNIWRLMNSDAATQRRNLGDAIIYGIFKKSIWPCIAMFWKWKIKLLRIFALCSLFLTTIIFFAHFMTCRYAPELLLLLDWECYRKVNECSSEPARTPPHSQFLYSSPLLKMIKNAKLQIHLIKIENIFLHIFMFHKSCIIIYSNDLRLVEVKQE